jgi:hypothetical protein
MMRGTLHEMLSLKIKILHVQGAIEKGEVQFFLFFFLCLCNLNVMTLVGALRMISFFPS